MKCWTFHHFAIGRVGRGFNLEAFVGGGGAIFENTR